jgi:steroid delta-isomerase-like uncharacterized protein
MTSSDTDTKPLGLEPIRDFASRYLDAWNSHDAARMAPLLSDDVVWADPALPEPASGIAAVQDFMRTGWRAFPDLRFEEPDPPHLSVAGDRVAWAWRMHGTMLGPLEPPGFAPTARPMVVDGVDLWTMRGDRIVRYRAFYDLTDLSRQLGILPPPGSRAERVTVALQRLQARLARRR